MCELFGLAFYDGKLDCLIDDLEKEIESNKKVSVFTPNVDHIINNSNNFRIRKIYSQSEYIIADGWPLVAVGKLKKFDINRITGVDLMEKLLCLSNYKKYNIFFLGATDSTLRNLIQHIKEMYPNIGDISYNHGYFEDNEEVIKKINSKNNSILFVGMGNPKQEIWIRENFNRLNSNLILGVGGAFKIFSGEVSRAPKVIQKIGMEWFYRFLQEPRRLFPRYFIKYPKFIRLLISEFI